MHPIALGEDVIERVTQRRGRLHLYDRFDPEQTALVVIDMQNAFCKPGAPVEVPVSLNDRMSRGVVGLPHGYGLEHPDESGQRDGSGPAINVLTDARHCDPLTATPYHKYVPCQIEAV